jgi:hypothetical protein
MSIKELKKLSTDDLEKGIQSSKFDAFNKLKAERVCGHKPIVGRRLVVPPELCCRMSGVAPRADMKGVPFVGLEPAPSTPGMSISSSTGRTCPWFLLELMITEPLTQVSC